MMVLGTVRYIYKKSKKNAHINPAWTQNVPLVDFTSSDRCRVRFCRCQMSQNLGIVNTRPQKGRQRKLVNVVPGKLLSEKVITAGFTEHLRQLSRVSKRIRKPKYSSSLSKVLFKKPLATH